MRVVILRFLDLRFKFCRIRFLADIDVANISSNKNGTKANSNVPETVCLDRYYCRLKQEPNNRGRFEFCAPTNGRQRIHL